MIVDIVVGAVVLISALISFLRGFIREILTIIGVVGGIAAAYFLGPKFIPMVEKWYGIADLKPEDKMPEFGPIPMDIITSVTAYGLIFLVVVAVLSIASHFLAAGAKAVGLGPVDRTLGVIFGIARAVILLALLYWPASVIMDDEAKESFFGESKTHIYISKTTDFIAGFFPKDDGPKPKSAKENVKDSLMEMDLLKREGLSEKAKDEPEKKAPGYKEEQREELDKLFERPQFND